MYPCYPPLVYSCEEVLVLPPIFSRALFYNFNIDYPIVKEFLKTFVFGKESSGKQFET